MPLEDGEYELATVVEGSDDGELVAQLPGGGFVLLDAIVTPELEAEGWARDAIRQVADARRGADLDVSDRIVLTLAAAPDRAGALETHLELIAMETLATTLTVKTDETLAANEVLVTLYTVTI